MYNEVDLLFLDVEMPVLNGFDLLNALPKKDFGLVFTTAYDEFAIKAIKHHALDYLLKPIDKSELIQAVETAVESKEGIELKLSEFMKDMEMDVSLKLSIPTNEGIELIEVQEILHCESDSNYTHVHLMDNRKYTISRTLKEIEEQINSDDFLRVHQSHLVNFSHVEKYVKGTNGSLVLKNGVAIPVSRRKKTELQERML